MRELSLNVLDIAQNSISAGASLIEIEIAEDTHNNEMVIGIYDNGRGMTPEQVQNVQVSLAWFLKNVYSPQAYQDDKTMFLLLVLYGQKTICS